MSKIIDIQCQTCKPVSGDCPSCGNDSGGVIAQGVRLIDDAGQSHYVPIGYMATWDMSGVSMTSHGKTYRINVSDTTYIDVKEIIDALCACSDTGVPTHVAATVDPLSDPELTIDPASQVTKLNLTAIKAAISALDALSHAAVTLNSASNGRLALIGQELNLNLSDIENAIIDLITSKHPAATFTNTATPFIFDTITQTGNIPLVGTLTDIGGGKYTFTPGDGSTTTTFQTLSPDLPRYANDQEAIDDGLALGEFYIGSPSANQGVAGAVMIIQ